MTNEDVASIVSTTQPTTTALLTRSTGLSGATTYTLASTAARNATSWRPRNTQRDYGYCRPLGADIQVLDLGCGYGSAAATLPQASAAGSPAPTSAKRSWSWPAPAARRPTSNTC